MTPFSLSIWKDKYRFLDELDITASWRRVARALASVEAEPQVYEDLFYSILEDFKFLPAGRIMAGAGTGRNVTLSNCFVMGTIPDSMDGIFTHLREAALTMQAGGGIGYDFSTLRPKGARVHGFGTDASGPLPFMDCWNAMCKTVMSAGSRRGAMMATMRCDHPDILDFIKAKREAGRLTNFNVSVLVTDKFMEAVEADGEWVLQFDGIPYDTVAARFLWDEIMRSTYDYAEPGVIFIDRVNRSNNIWYLGPVAATNPCGEKPMQPYDSCILGSINLARLVLDPFTTRARLNTDELHRITRIAVRLLDNVIDVNRYPLEAQAAKAKETRQIGLGVTGLADALAMLRIPYSSPAARTAVEDWMSIITTSAYSASYELAKEKGAFPAFDKEKFYARDTFARAFMSTAPIRNSLLISIAPTGTISLVAGNVSSGIEPIFATSYTRKVLQPDGSHREELIEDYAVSEYRRLFPNTPLPTYFETAQTLSPQAHVLMQASVQKWTDSSISKTVNCPEDISFDDFKDIYRLAYDSGCKGCTTYRPSGIRGSVLSVETSVANAEQAAKDYMAPNKIVEEVPPLPGEMFEPAPRPESLPGQTYKVKLSETALYITINDIEENGVHRPFEIFIASKNPEHAAWTTALTRMLSAIFRRPHDSRFVVEELKAVHDPKGGGWWRSAYWPSEVAVIGQVIEDHMKSIGYMQTIEIAGMEIPMKPTTAKTYRYEPKDFIPRAAPTPQHSFACPACQSRQVKRESGCLTCLSCGYSKCS